MLGQIETEVQSPRQEAVISRRIALLSVQQETHQNTESTTKTPIIILLIVLSSTHQNIFLNNICMHKNYQKIHQVQCVWFYSNPQLTALPEIVAAACICYKPRLDKLRLQIFLLQSCMVSNLHAQLLLFLIYEYAKPYF